VSKLVIVALLTALMLPSSVRAAEWWYVAAGKQVSVFADRSSVAVSQVNGRNVIRAWAAYFNSTVVNGYKSEKSQSYYDCSQRMSAFRSSIEYGTDGMVKNSRTLNDYQISWSPLAPDTVGEALLNFVCNVEQAEIVNGSFTIEGIEFIKVDDLDEASKILTPKPIGVATAVPTVPRVRKTIPQR